MAGTEQAAELWTGREQIEQIKRSAVIVSLHTWHLSMDSVSGLRDFLTNSLDFFPTEKKNTIVVTLYIDKPY